MNLSDIQKEISARYDLSGTSISDTSNEWARRKTLINAGLKRWAEKLMWKELIRSSQITINANTNNANLPSDCDGHNILLSDLGRLKIGDYYYDKINFNNIKEVDANSYYIYVLDNKIYINPTPTVNTTFDLYYKSNLLAWNNTKTTHKAELDLVDDIPKLSSPDYLVYWTLAEMFLADDEVNKSVTYERKAIEILNRMITADKMEAPYQLKPRNITFIDGIVIGGDYD